ncbi:hypothetical protein TSOC_001862 [Tetrabaena socialis]|uniref:Uncharacterized protein n=1 Tax=Tetrabaena socialis TaxID=47790 RepID=A0A2J8AFM3_9CHLO|nr:hypothetical protein TSOC_001862 [Tetrabaena socialis]|eukprot:PNH11321.1 hypothetical protein TSOC_001862 [Tetrabaena socialis]
MPIAFTWNWLICGGACYVAQTPDINQIGQPLRRAANAIRRHSGQSSSSPPGSDVGGDDESNP